MEHIALCAVSSSSKLHIGIGAAEHDLEELAGNTVLSTFSLMSV